MKNSIIFMLICSGVIILLFFTEAIGFWGLIGLMILIFFIGMIWDTHEKEKERKEKRHKWINELKSLDGFSPTKKFVTTQGIIAIDNNNKQIALRGFGGKIKKYPYSAILSCEVIEDGETTYRKSSTVGRAIVGGLIAGGAGAIVGGLSGKNKENKEIKHLDLKVVIKDTNNPSFKIRFFDARETTGNTKESVKVTDSGFGDTLKENAKQLEIWKDRIEAIIAQMDSSKENT